MSFWFCRQTPISNSPVLTLATVKRLDAGTYQCKADNGVGQPQFKKMDLLITCKFLIVKRMVWVNKKWKILCFGVLFILFATGKSFDDVGPVLMEYDGRGETEAMLLTIHQTPSSHKKDLYEICKRKNEDKVG